MTTKIRHIVLVSWAEGASGDRIAGLRARVRGLPALIPGIEAVAEGASVSPEGLEGAFDWGFVMTLSSAAERDGYLTHAAHLPVAAEIGALSQSVVVFDIAE